MNNTKANLWLFRKKTKDITFSYEIKQKARFVKGSIIAIICGLIIGGIIIAAQNVNPFIYLKYLFHIGFNGLFVNQTIQWLCIYIIAGLAVGIGFKSGMFNIGVSGQMVMGAGIAIIFFKLAVAPHLAEGQTMNAGYIIVMFLICAFSGAIMAGIAGALKALFNIHEVVTTIMLNWTAWYLMKYLFTKFSTTIGGHGIASSGSIPGGSLTIHGSTIAIPIIIAVIAVIVIAIILSKTVFGYKLKAVGASPSASKYAGFSVKRKMIDAMLISGLLAGVASFVNIFTITPNITFAVDNLPQIGYDSIAITLVAFNNPIGMVFSSFLWAVLQSGGSSTASLFNLPTQMSQLIFGVIVYFAAISVVFINWYPVIKLRIMIALTSSKANQIKIKNLRKQQLEYRKELMNINRSEDVRKYKEFIQEQIAEQKRLLNESSKTKQDIADTKKAIRDLKIDMNLYVKEHRKNLKEMISKISSEIKAIKKDNYISRINSAKEGIDRREWNAIREVEEDALSRASLVKSDVLSLKDNYKKDLKDKKNWLRTKLSALRKEYKLKLNQNDVWLESETGIKNHFWEMKNGKIEAKALINKFEIETHNKILTIRSDHQMAKLDVRAKNKNHPEKIAEMDKILLAKMKRDIHTAKLEEKQFIKDQKERIAELTKTYKANKKANELLAKQILEKKRSTKIKLAKNLKKQKAETRKFVKGENIILNAERKSLHELVANTINEKVNLDSYKETLKGLRDDLKAKNVEFTKSLKGQMGIKKALVGESGRLLKELNAENERDRKAIAKINDKNNTTGASLVDIQLAYNQRNQRVRNWYAEKKALIMHTHKDVQNLANTKKSEKDYNKVVRAMKQFKAEVKKIGFKNTFETINAKKKLLTKLIKDIHKIWPDEYSTIDNNYWTKKRFNVYVYINNEQAKLSKINIVINAHNKIKNIERRAKLVRKMYNQNIKTFKDAYMVNKKIDAVRAQQNYHKQIEEFINKLEHSDFKEPIEISLKEVM